MPDGALTHTAANADDEQRIMIFWRGKVLFIDGSREMNRSIHCSAVYT